MNSRPFKKKRVDAFRSLIKGNISGLKNFFTESNFNIFCYMRQLFINTKIYRPTENPVTLFSVFSDALQLHFSIFFDDLEF